VAARALHVLPPAEAHPDAAATAEPSLRTFVQVQRSSAHASWVSLSQLCPLNLERATCATPCAHIVAFASSNAPLRRCMHCMKPAHALPTGFTKWHSRDVVRLGAGGSGATGGVAAARRRSCCATRATAPPPRGCYSPSAIPPPPGKRNPGARAPRPGGGGGEICGGRMKRRRMQITHHQTVSLYIDGRVCGLGGAFSGFHDGGDEVC
jgi:hypothetical protein